MFPRANLPPPLSGTNDSGLHLQLREGQPGGWGVLAGPWEGVGGGGRGRVSLPLEFQPQQLPAPSSSSPSARQNISGFGLRGAAPAEFSLWPSEQWQTPARPAEELPQFPAQLQQQH